MHSIEVRKSFEAFFKEHDHMHLPSFPLVPKDDPTLLYINAGMAPLKVYFEGRIAPPHPRVTTIQKCFRAIDIDEVGRTPRHNTFFEMLGNFSFGDYFKKEIIPWSWDYLTNWVKLPVEKLAVSVHEQDDEAYDIWHKDVGLPESKIFRLGDADNFWMMAETGPCGPDSEIFYDLGEKFGCDNPNCGPGCNCERWPEIWNLVFTQFNLEADGSRITLPKKNVDTGMGMERLCMVLQGVTSVFETDLFAELLQFATSISAPEVIGEKAYITEGVNSLYVFCDHVRASAFLLADGIYPSNDGRGYVLRRIIRRSLIHLRKLKTDGPVLVKALEPIIDKYGEIYPSLVDKREYISELLSIEEENFAKLIERNYEHLRRVTENSQYVLHGDEAFYFYDTLGVPIDLIRDVAHSLGKEIDEDRFSERLEEQRSKARSATASHKDDDKFMHEGLELPEGIQATEVVCYDTDKISAMVLYVDEKSGVVVLDHTPFYPEGGGQVSDKGILTAGDITVNVIDAQTIEGGVVLHQAAPESKASLAGLIEKQVEVQVDSERRRAIRRAHTATHLLHAALRMLLGDHVTQSGSKVEEDEFRFDLTHFKALSEEEIDAVTKLVNKWSLAGFPVNVKSTTLKDAREQKAMALFEGKYDEEVRMIEIGFLESIISRELCGGLHIDNTSEIGLFIITSETGVAAGVRRITAVTGLKAFNIFMDLRNILSQGCTLLDGCGVPVFIPTFENLIAEKEAESKELKKLKWELRKDIADEIIEIDDYIDDIHIITAEIPDVTIDELRELGDRIKKKSEGKAAILLTHSTGDKVSIVVMLTDDLMKMGFKAGNLMRLIAPIVGGKGGGKPAMAQGGGIFVDKVPDAFDAFKKAISEGPG